MNRKEKWEEKRRMSGYYNCGACGRRAPLPAKGKYTWICADCAAQQAIQTEHNTKLAQEAIHDVRPRDN